MNLSIVFVEKRTGNLNDERSGFILYLFDFKRFLNSITNRRWRNICLLLPKYSDHSIKFKTKRQNTTVFLQEVNKVEGENIENTDF